MDGEHVMSVWLGSGERAALLEDDLRVRLPDADIARNASRVSVAIPDDASLRRADAAVTAFVAEHPGGTEVTVRRWDPEAEQWRQTTRTYRILAGWSETEAVDAVDVVWVDIARLHWEARMTYADEDTADAAADELLVIPDSLLEHRPWSLTVSLFVETEDEARALARLELGRGRAESVAIRKLSRLQRWLLAGRLGGNYTGDRS